MLLGQLWHRLTATPRSVRVLRFPAENAAYLLQIVKRTQPGLLTDRERLMGKLSMKVVGSHDNQSGKRITHSARTISSRN